MNPLCLIEKHYLVIKSIIEQGADSVLFAEHTAVLAGGELISCVRLCGN